MSSPIPVNQPVNQIAAALARRLICAAILAAFAAASWAQAATHRGVPAEDLITLELRNDVKGGCGEAKLDFVRLFPDGTSDAGVFRVTEGRALIVTDVDWHYFNGPPGLVVVLSVLIENLADPTRRRRAFESAVRLGPDGVGGASEQMTTGFAVAPEARPCLDVVNGPIGSPLRLSKVLLRGYLVDAAN